MTETPNPTVERRIDRRIEEMEQKAETYRFDDFGVPPKLAIRATADAVRDEFEQIREDSKA